MMKIIRKLFKKKRSLIRKRRDFNLERAICEAMTCSYVRDGIMYGVQCSHGHNAMIDVRVVRYGYSFVSREFCNIEDIYETSQNGIDNVISTLYHTLI